MYICNELPAHRPEPRVFHAGLATHEYFASNGAFNIYLFL